MLVIGVIARKRQHSDHSEIAGYRGPGRTCRPGKRKQGKRGTPGNGGHAVDFSHGRLAFGGWVG